MRAESDSRESSESGADDDWPWAYEVRRAARVRASAKKRIALPLPFAMAGAAFVYPFLVSPLLAVWRVASDLHEGSVLTFGEVVAGIVGYPFHAATTEIVMAIGAALLCSLIWLAAYYMARSFQKPLDEGRLAMHVGGWTALVGTSGVLLPYFALSRVAPTLSLFILAMALGPGLAIPLGQYAAAWGLSPGALDRIRAAKPQFGLLQLLVTTTWTALGLGVAKWFGVLSVWPLLYLVGWAAYAWLTMGLVLRFCVRRSKRVIERSGGDGGEMRG